MHRFFKQLIWLLVCLLTVACTMQPMPVTNAYDEDGNPVDGEIVTSDGAEQTDEGSSEEDSSEGGISEEGRNENRNNEESGQMTATLEGTPWQLVSMGAEGNMVPPIAETMITLAFEGSTVEGDGGCNSYFGSYTVDGSSLSIELPASTLMFCESPAGVMEQEEAYILALNGATSFEIEGNELRILYQDGVLIYQSSESTAVNANLDAAAESRISSPASATYVPFITSG
ncbi:MAG: META domain-containing protein [Chloroflexota bacterium]